MKKISFNDKCDLTRCVLDGKKTQLRKGTNYCCTEELKHLPKPIAVYIPQKYIRYKVGEIVAVAQTYYDISNYHLKINVAFDFTDASYAKGFDNKACVKASEMPHHVRITNVMFEPLQNISDEDCMKEGISKVDFALKDRGLYSFRFENEWYNQYHTPREAFAAMIDLIYGKGTWSKNQLYIVYEFELVD